MDYWDLVPFIVIREAAMFAAAGYLVLGVNELAIDVIWIKVKVSAWRQPATTTDAETPDHSAASSPPLAVFIPAWQEGNIIRDMLRATLKAADYPNFRLYVGCYPNDPGTIEAVKSVPDPRIRLVIGPRPGGTTKADCLNTIWRAMVEDERQEGRSFDAVILQDAEDVIHPQAFRQFGRFIGDYDMVQLPVVPILSGSLWVAAHYGDEFAEAHAKDMIVRQHIGAALPSAGVGCAFARKPLEELAARRGDGPFNPDSLTEDYELGLTIGRKGRALFLRARDEHGRLIATGEYFPSDFRAAVRQKARWIAGIALAGWDRLGWRDGLAEHWMRLRDRQPLFVALVTMIGYGAIAAWPLLGLGAEDATRLFSSSAFSFMAAANITLFGWRLLVRFAFTTLLYGWRQGLLSVPRLIVSTLILVAAAAQAARLYASMRRTGVTRWDKTVHRFPAHLAD
ncbi:glycosyl transferase family protein [Allosphingosinicella vermicomposti]|uniref:glycosyl transferase family protein n=1 Tax=Allosphingosinicella vermicomposti TaxID=614671 RepID=UPI000D0EEDBA|nr:glycosyl transferase family protein [Allosphingosinicella vermicomposti]